jgi:hypothetical protein
LTIAAGGCTPEAAAGEDAPAVFGTLLLPVFGLLLALVPPASFDDAPAALSADGAGAAFGADFATGALADVGAEALAVAATAGMAVA